jgi:hypothetical protein
MIDLVDDEPNTCGQEGEDKEPLDWRKCCETKTFSTLGATPQYYLQAQGFERYVTYAHPVAVGY